MNTDEDFISVIDLAQQIGKQKQGIFKIIKRFGIEQKISSSAASRGQSVSMISAKDAEIIKIYIASKITDKFYESSDGAGEPEELYPESRGVFYLLRLEPDHDPGRFKVGFTTNVQERLRTLRCSAPLLEVIKTWPCKSLWEKTAIDSVTDGCERLHVEVFRTISIETVIAKCDRFFGVMPSIQK